MTTTRITLTPALADLMGEPGTSRPAGRLDFFDTADEAQQWLLDRLGSWQNDIEVLAATLTCETETEQVAMVQTMLDPEGAFLGADNAASWLRGMRHALRSTWALSAYRTADGRVGVISDGVGSLFGQAFI